MLRCPFCQTDVDDAELRSGRCPKCGSLLAWNEDEDDRADAATSGDLEDPTAELPATGGPEEEPGEGSPEAEAAAAATENADDGGAPPQPGPAPASSAAAPPERPPANPEIRQTLGGGSAKPGQSILQTMQPSPLSPQESESLEKAWKRTISPETRANTTIKTDSEIGDTQFAGDSIGVSVPPRQVQRTPGAQGVPADYHIIELIGQGGAGYVYSARQSSINRTVAIKMLRPESVHRNDERQKFLSEAVVTGDLDHPNIVPIHDLGIQENGTLFYSMKRVVGTPWSDVLHEKTQPGNIEILMKVADAVAFAHARGIVHRDLKPENVMLGDYGEVLVMDWGIALATPEFAKNRSILETGSLGGTPAYMAPEMAKGPVGRIQPYSDVYLLGGILFEIITGLTPHTGYDVMDCLRAAAANRIQPTDASGELLDIALKAMSTNPEDRFESVFDFKAAIREYQSHTESITLAVRAEEDLVEARESDDYQDFARALFAFEEAVALWDGNQRAAKGVVETRLEYAESARGKGDYDLGISLLDETESSHQGLLSKLRKAQQERDARQQRLKTVKRIAGLLVVVLFAVISFAGISIWQAKEEAVEAKDSALIAKRNEERQRLEAVSLKKEADGKAAQALEAEGKALVARNKAIAATNAANIATSAAMAAKKREEIAKLQTEYEAYIAQIALAAKEIENNSFDEARRLLRVYENSDLRHWEWGRLWYLCQRSRVDFDCRGPVEAVAFSPRGDRFVTGSRDGTARIWQTTLDPTNHPQQPLELVHSPDQAVRAVAWCQTASQQQFVATAGVDRIIRVWERKQDRFELRHTLKNHTGAIEAVEFSMTSRFQWLVSGSRDNSVIIWDLNTGKQIVKLQGHSWWVWDVAVSPSQNRIVSAGQDGKIIVWAVNTSKGVPVVTPISAVNAESRNGTYAGDTKVLVGYHDGPVYSVAFSPDGKRVVSGGFDNRVLIWNPETARSFDLKQQLDPDRGGTQSQSAFARRGVLELRGHTAPVRSVSFSPEQDQDGGRLVLSSADDNTVNVWNSKTGRLMQTLRGHGSWVRSCAFAPDGSKGFAPDAESPDDRVVLSGGHDGIAKLWRIAGYDEVRMIRGRFLAGNEDAVLGLAVDRRGTRIATAGKDRIARVHELDGNLRLAGEIRTFGEGHDFLATNGRFARGSADKEQRFFTAGMDNTVRMWNVATGAELARLAETGRHATLALSPDGRWLATGFARNENSTIDSGANAGRVIALIWRVDDLDHPGNPTPAELVVIPAASRDPDGRPRTPPSATALSFSADSRTLLVGDDLGGVFEWPVQQKNQRLRRLGSQVGGISHTKRINSCVYFPDGRRAATASSDNTMLIWDRKTGKALDSLIFPDSVSAVDVSPDGSRLLGVSRSQQGATLKVWSTAAPLQRDRFSEITLPGRLVTSARFFPNENRVLIVTRNAIGSTNRGSSRGTGKSAAAADREQERVMLYQWDTRSGAAEPLWTAGNIGQSVWSAACSPDGKRILTIGGRYARLRSRADGRQLMVFGPHRTVTSVSFSRNSDLLATAEDGDSVKVWSVGTRRPLQRLVGIHSGAVGTAEFSPVDNLRLMTAGTRTVKFWELDPASGNWNQFGPTLHVVANAAPRAKQPQAKSARRQARIVDATYSPDATLVAVAFDDATAGVWDVKTGKRLSSLAGRYGHTDALTCIRFSPDGRWLMTGSRDRTAIIWERGLSEWTAIARLTGHPAPVNSVSISHDRQRVLTGSDDKTAKLWDTSLLAHAGVIRPGAERSLVIQRIRDDLELTLNARQRLQDAGADQRWRGDVLSAVQRLVKQPPLAGDESIQQAVPRQPGELQNIAKLIDAIESCLEQVEVGDVRRIEADQQMEMVPAPANVKPSVSQRELNRVADAVAAVRLLVAGPATVREIFTLRGHTREVTAVAFAPSGQYVVTGSKDGTAVLWPAVNLSAVVAVAQDELVITPEQRRVAVAPHAEVRDADARNFANSRLVIRLRGERAANEARLKIMNPPNSLIQIENGRIRYRATANAPAREFGRIVDAVEGPQLTFTFNELADAAHVSALIRLVQLDAVGLSEQSPQLNVDFQIVDRHGRASAVKSRSIRYLAPEVMKTEPAPPEMMP